MSQPETPNDPTGPAGGDDESSVTSDAADGAAGTPPPPPPGPPPGPRQGDGDPPGPRPHTPPRLTRRGDDRVLCGVAGGLGDYFNVDPALFRLAFVALTFMGGIGPVLYGLGWLFLPERATGESVGEDLVRRAGGARSLGRWIILGLVATLLVGLAPLFDSGLAWAVLLIAVGVLFFRREEPAAEDNADDTATAPIPRAPPPADPAPDSTIPTEPRRYQPVPRSGSSFDDWRPTPITAPPEPPPPPSVLGRITVAAALIVGGLVALTQSLTPLSVSVEHYAALGLAIVGAGLLVGARLGRARGLIPLGIVLAVVLAVSASLPNLRLLLDFGDRSWTPATVADLRDSYDLGMGDMRLDLTELELDPGQRVAVNANLGMGELTVDVPSDVSVDVNAASAMGSVEALGRTSDGTNAAVDEVFSGPEGSPTIGLDLMVGLGSIEVFREALPSETPTSPAAVERTEAS